MSKKLLMNKFENDVIENWDYEWYATEGKLPLNTNNDINNFGFEYIEDYLKISVNNGGAFIKFTTNKTTSTNAIIETSICGHRLFNVGEGIRVQLSNGVFGVQIRISSYDDQQLKIDKLYGKSANNRKRIRYIDVNTFYKIRIVLEGNTTKIYLDDVLVDTSDVSLAGTVNDVSYAEGCYTSTHGILFQNHPTLGSIKYIKFKEF